MYQDIIYALQDPVAIITMNRPDKLNAFTTRMLAEIRHAIAAAEKDERVVGIVLTGAGRGFCAGMDMGSLDNTSSGAREEREDLSDLAAEVGDSSMGDNFTTTYSYLLSVRKPLLGAINGARAGLGFVFAMLADMRFVERDAKFTTSFSQRGLIAEHEVSWILPRLIGTGRALDILWSSRKFDGAEAERLGIAERLVEPGESLAAASRFIEQLAASASPTSLRVMKSQAYRHLNMGLGDAMRETNEWMATSIKQEDFTEGVRSFIERRPPQFKRIRI
ncbi:MAG: enoyl-CoA hydratase-related protein [Pseudomonadales bacterium]